MSSLATRIAKKGSKIGVSNTKSADLLARLAREARHSSAAQS